MPERAGDRLAVDDVTAEVDPWPPHHFRDQISLDPLAQVVAITSFLLRLKQVRQARALPPWTFDKKLAALEITRVDRAITTLRLGGPQLFDFGLGEVIEALEQRPRDSVGWRKAPTLGRWVGLRVLL